MFPRTRAPTPATSSISMVRGSPWPAPAPPLLCGRQSRHWRMRRAPAVEGESDLPILPSTKRPPRRTRPTSTVLPQATTIGRVVRAVCIPPAPAMTWPRAWAPQTQRGYRRLSARLVGPAFSGSATDVAVGANGTAWAIGTVAAAAGGNQILEREGSSWTVMPGGAVEVAVAPDGSAWVVNSHHQIYHWNGRAVGP